MTRHIPECTQALLFMQFCSIISQMMKRHNAPAQHTRQYTAIIHWQQEKVSRKCTWSTMVLLLTIWVRIEGSLLSICWSCTHPAHEVAHKLSNQESTMLAEPCVVRFVHPADFPAANLPYCKYWYYGQAGKMKTCAGRSYSHISSHWQADVHHARLDNQKKCQPELCNMATCKALERENLIMANPFLL